MVLQLVLYYDEVEVTNSLGSSRGKHKLGKYILLLFIFYCYFYHSTLLLYIGNLHPMLRSSLKAIQLIVTVTYPNLLEYGYKPIL